MRKFTDTLTPAQVGSVQLQVTLARWDRVFYTACFLHDGVVCPHKNRFTEETDMDCQATSHFSVSQCDFPSITGPISPAPIYVGVSCPAKRLLPQQRQGLAIQVLAGTETVSELARQHEVSRKFLYQQVHTAEEALSEAFAPSSRPDDVLFYLPVTKAWLRQLVLGLVFICHSSTRGVVELLRDLFDFQRLRTRLGS